MIFIVSCYDASEDCHLQPSFNCVWNLDCAPVFVLLAADSWCKGTSASSARSPVVYEERMRPSHWLELVLCVALGALTLMLG